MENQLVDLTKYLALLDLGILLVGGVVAAIGFPRLATPWKYLAGYLWLVGLTELLSKLYLYVLTDSNGLYLYHLYAPIEFLVLSLMYRELLQLNPPAKARLGKVIYALTALVSGYSLWELIGGYLQPYNFQLYSKVVGCGAIMTLALWLFIRILQHPRQFLNDQDRVLGLNSAVLLYFSGSFSLFLMMTYLVYTEVEQNIPLWLGHVILIIVLHFVSLLVVWPRKKALLQT